MWRLQGRQGIWAKEIADRRQARIPAFKKPEEAQMSESDLAHTRQVAGAKIIVERVVGRVKQFHILDRPIFITLITIGNQIFLVCHF